MSCDVTQNRLLAQAGDTLPPEVSLHLESCELCRLYQSRMNSLQLDLRALPTPSSADRKAAFLEELTSLGPVVRTRPVLLSQQRKPVWAQWTHLPWKIGRAHV